MPSGISPGKHELRIAYTSIEKIYRIVAVGPLQHRVDYMVTVLRSSIYIRQKEPYHVLSSSIVSIPCCGGRPVTSSYTGKNLSQVRASCVHTASRRKRYYIISSKMGWRSKASQRSRLPHHVEEAIRIQLVAFAWDQRNALPLFPKSSSKSSTVELHLFFGHFNVLEPSSP